MFFLSNFIDLDLLTYKIYSKLKISSDLLSTVLGLLK